MVQVFGRLFSLLTHKHREAAHIFQAVPELLNDLLTLRKWRLNFYYYFDVLILSHVIDPSLKFTRLKKDVWTPQEIFEIMSSFANRCCNFSVDAIIGPRSATMELKKEFCQWIRPDISLAESMAAEKEGFI